mmetsp:Transcript_30343/g.96827  ORF Transcript_30343/g.96827 Transcript_30343/m.96827 type:complete len:457 (+) Transcript_30343:291-1661(+)|eukprot:CAMPEP_0118871082 /NCGR_PEP_ID=MMETSP1163-20130328/13799_1 /TAXON_ID=124430 /ORGANISM="Phaeomonas parva, Strain CCMP2877" /LENGTH=456 /DNA_ID=CAMNT_0006806149 /DNA_START=330 /DNA_END=1700 /DNA_ORIENTATION=-
MPAVRPAPVGAPSLLRNESSIERLLVGSQVAVFVRVRPPSSKESKSRTAVSKVSATGIQVDRADDDAKASGADGNKQYTYDCCFGSADGQQVVFDHSCPPIIDRFISGYHGTIFAYGQTGSGKTYTMFGPEGAASGSDEAGDGIIPRCCRGLFDRIRADTTKTYALRITYIEMYQEELRDLLTPSARTRDASMHREATEGGEKKPFGSRGTGLQNQHRLNTVDLRAGEGGKGVRLVGAVESDVGSPEEVLEYIALGNRNRVVGSTHMNEHSSRSHAILTLYLSSRDKDDPDGLWTRADSKLHLVDLAGSERAKQTQATGQRLKEGAAINTSLSALGNVVNALTQRPRRSHIPYRDSKLTRLLQDALGGNGFTSMICNVSPTEASVSETLSSLRFAQRMKEVENKAVQNRDPRGARVRELLEENRKLKERVAELEKQLGDTPATNGGVKHCRQCVVS